MGFFRLDGPFFKYGTLLCDIIILSFFWCVCSLPIITIGPATAALYYVTTKLTVSREGYVTIDFFKSFAGNFIQGLISWLIFIFIGGVLFFNIINFHPSGSVESIISIIQFVLLFELAITLIYVFPLIARFKMSIKDIFKSAFFMANRHFFTTITCFLLLAAVLYGVFIFGYMILPFLFIIPGTFAYLTSFMIMRVFKKYMPEMDTDISVDGRNAFEEKHRAEKEAEKLAEKERTMEEYSKKENNSEE